MESVDYMIELMKSSIFYLNLLTCPIFYQNNAVKPTAKAGGISGVLLFRKQILYEVKCETLSGLSQRTRTVQSV